MIDLDEDGGLTTGWWPKAVAAAAVLALLGGGAYHEWASARGPIGGDGCPRSGPSTLNVIGIDTTDPLLAANPGRVNTAVTRLVDDLPGHARLVVAPIDADVIAELRPILNYCAPPRAEDENVIITPRNPRRRARSAFEHEVADAVRRLARAPDAARSPLTEQIVKIVTDARVLANAPRDRTLTVFSDFLQASDTGNAYRGRLRLPARPPRVLAGWRVRFVQTTNLRDHALQTDAIREEWRRWATAAGAISVSFEGSGFLEGASAR